MARFSKSESPIAKRRQSLEIDTQVSEFLRRGGSIEVLDLNSNRQQPNIGSVWHEQEELLQLKP